MLPALPEGEFDRVCGRGFSRGGKSVAILIGERTLGPHPQRPFTPSCFPRFSGMQNIPVITTQEQ